MIYRGIDLSKNEDILNWIDTYRYLDDKNLETYLDNDSVFQNLLRQQEIKKKINVIALFIIYSVVSAILLLKG